MAETVLVPQQGNSVESVILLQWHKDVGDSVAEGDVLCEVETDKTTMEVESTAAGTILQRLAEEGDEIAVKTGLVIIGEAGEVVAEHEEPRSVEQPESTPQPVVPPSAPVEQSGFTRGLRVSPRARQIAERLGVILESLDHGSGPGGRILEKDVLAAHQQAPPSASAAAPAVPPDAARQSPSPTAGTAAPKSSPETEVVPVRGIRNVIAQRMRESLTTTAQLTIHSSADARGLLQLRNRFKTAGEALGMNKITINDMVMFAYARTLRDHGAVNAHFYGTEIHRFPHVDLSFAVDTERGLLVPTITNAGTCSLAQLSARARELAQRCIDGTATAEDLKTGTSTATNLGSFGVEYFTPVLNPPQVAILGISTIQLKAVAMEDGTIEHVPHIGLSLTFDHQALDGAPAARFLQDLSRRIAVIEMLLAD